MSTSPGLIDEVRQFMRLHHYSIHTERAYCDWIKRFVRYHGMTRREDLQGGETRIEAFLTHLAIDPGVAPSTQNQAMNILVFWYKKVLEQALDDEINAVRAPKKTHVPVVMSREEVAQVITLMGGTARLVVKLLYGRRRQTGSAHGRRRPGDRGWSRPASDRAERHTLRSQSYTKLMD